MGAGVQLAQLAIGKSCKLGDNLQYDGPALTSEGTNATTEIIV